MATISIVALRSISLPHRTLAAGEALDFGRADDLAFFVSRLRWSAFKIEAIDGGGATRSEIDATCHQALREAADQLKAAHAENAQHAHSIAALEAEIAKRDAPPSGTGDGDQVHEPHDQQPTDTPPAAAKPPKAAKPKT